MTGAASRPSPFPDCRARTGVEVERSKRGMLVEIEAASDVRLRVLSLPTEDEIFAEFIARTLREIPSLSTPRRLRIHLRPLYPRLVIQPRRLVEPRPTWYVFRDGRIRSRPAADGWWREPGIPAATVDMDGRITRANDALAALGGLVSAASMANLAITAFAPPGMADDVRRLFGVILEDRTRSGETAIRFHALGGAPRDVWMRVAPGSSGLRVWLTSLELDPDVPEITPLAWPSTDLAFVGMVERYVERIDAASPEAAVGHLGRALGEYYPKVSLHLRPSPVPGLGRVVEVFRDGQPLEIRDRWWEDGGTAQGVVRDSDGRYVEANEALAALFGVTVAELLAATSGAFTPPEIRDDALWLYTVLRRVGQLDTTTRVRRADGSDLNVLVHSVRDGAGMGLHSFAMRPLAE